MSSEIKEGLKVAEKEDPSPEPIRILLLIGAAFFISWGPGLQKVIPVINSSRIFSLFALGLAIYWLILGKNRFRNFPLPFNLFFWFALIHTIVCYLIIFPGEFKFGYSDALYSQADYFLYAPLQGTMVIRFFLFILLAYAVGSLLKNRREFHFFCLTYGLGFFLSLLLGEHKSIDAIRGFSRATGGFLSPNTLGMTGLVCTFLNLAVFLNKNIGTRAKVISALFILAGIYGMLASVSRNTIVACACGLAVVTIYLPLLKKVRWTIVFGCLLLAAAALLPSSIYETLTQRLTVENIQESNWSMRRDIWSDYLSVGDKYFWSGMGLDRSREAVREIYTSDSNKPLIPHQTYLQVLVEFGITGLILFLAALWTFIKRGITLASSRLEGAENVVMLSLLVALAVYGLTGSILGERSIWPALGLIAFTQTSLGRNTES